MTFTTLPVNKANFKQLESSIGPVVSGLLITFLCNSMQPNGSSKDNGPSVIRHSTFFSNQSFVTIMYCLPLTYIDPVNMLTFYLFKISFNTIPPSFRGPPSDHLS